MSDHLDAADPLSVEQEVVLANLDLELHQVVRAHDGIIQEIETTYGIEIEWANKAMLLNYLRWAYAIGKGLADPDEDLTDLEA